MGFTDERTRPEFVASLLAVFAGFASVLALVGMHGVIAYAVGQREREIAVRMAVGADPRAITTLFLRQGGLVLAPGLGAGVAGALALGSVLRSLLFGVAPDDPAVLASVTAARMSPRETGIRRTRACIASTDSASSTGSSVTSRLPVVCSTIASSSARLG